MLVSIRKYQNSNIQMFASFNTLTFQEKSKVKRNPSVGCFYFIPPQVHFLLAYQRAFAVCQFECLEQEVPIPVLIRGQKKEIKRCEPN